jgi:hypothetical protein
MRRWSSILLELPTLNVSRHCRTAQQTLKSWVQIPDVKLGRARYLRSETSQMLPVNISKKEREEMTHKITYDVLSRIAMLARSKGLRDFDYAVWISSSTSLYLWKLGLACCACWLSMSSTIRLASALRSSWRRLLVAADNGRGAWAPGGRGRGIARQ